MTARVLFTVKRPDCTAFDDAAGSAKPIPPAVLRSIVRLIVDLEGASIYYRATKRQYGSGHVGSTWPLPPRAESRGHPDACSRGNRRAP
jgi:hypothetical protein